MLKKYLSGRLTKAIVMAAAAAVLMGIGLTPAWADGGVTVQVERVPGINNKADVPVKLGTVHIAEDRDLPETMWEGDFIELALPEGMLWNDKTQIMLQRGDGGKYIYLEGEEYQLYDRSLTIILQGVTDSRDILTIEPWAEMDGFGGGKINLSITSDLLSPAGSNITAVGQCVNYGVEVETSDIVTAEAGKAFKPAVIMLQENCEGSFHMGEDVEITLPQGFTFADGKGFMTVKVVSGSDIFASPERRSDNVALLEIKRVSGSPTRAEITMQRITSPKDFSGDVKVRIKGELFDETVVVAEIEAAEEEKPEEKAPKTEEPKAEAPKTEETSPAAAAATAETRHTGGVFWIDSTSSIINGTTEKLGIAPYIREGRTYLPVRYVAHALGIEDENIIWDAATRMVVLRKGNTMVVLTIGSDKITVNDSTRTMDVVPEITDSYTMLPARWVVEAFGGEIEWVPEPPMITIYTRNDK